MNNKNTSLYKTGPTLSTCLPVEHHHFSKTFSFILNTITISGNRKQGRQVEGLLESIPETLP